MKKALLVNAVIVSLLFFLGMAVRSADAAMPLPSESEFYQYSSTENPVLSDDPSLAQPVSVGSVAVGGETLSMRINLHEISGAVDLYFGLYLPILDPVNIYLLDINNAFGTLAQGLVPFRQNVEGVIDEAIFGDLPVQGLPKGTYQIYLVVTPAGSLESYYFWQTSFFVGGWSITEVEAPIISAFGERGGFDAVLDAFNKGYSLQQIVEGSVTDRLQASGDIFQYGSGAMEAPRYPPMDFLVSSGLKKMGELHIQGTLKKDWLYDKFENASAGAVNALTLLMVMAIICDLNEDVGPSECFAEYLTDFIEKTAPEGCTTECVPCIKLSDGTTECPPEKGAIDLTKSFSGLGVTVTGPPSLKVGEAGTWTAAAVNGIEPFTYYFYWGDKSYTESTANAAQHSYSKAGNYNVVVRVDETVSGNDALSSALPVEVEDANGGGCGVITGWTEADAEAIILTPIDDWSYTGPDNTMDYSIFYIDCKWTVEQDYLWNLRVVVRSFADTVSAQACFNDLTKAVKVNPEDYVIVDNSSILFSWTSKYRLTGPEGDRAGDFDLMELYHGTFSIYVGGWPGLTFDDKGIAITSVRDHFLSIVNRIHNVIDSKCGF